jgi:transposase
LALAFAPWTESENIQFLLLCKRLYKRTSRRFCWTEAGAETVGIIHSLASTCRLLGINPYTDLVDVLQRIALHPDSQVEDFTPRRWKALFADNPLRSDCAFVT